MWLTGIDEAGRGPCLGPLVVGAVRIPQADLHLLEEEGVTDSKLLSKQRRQELYHWLLRQRDERGWTVASHSAQPLMIDQWMARGTLIEWELDLFDSAATIVVAEPHRGDGGILVLDACDVNADRFGNLVVSRLAGWPWNGWKVVSEHGADANHMVVGAASIVAKVERDEAVKNLSEEIGIDLGSGYPSDPKTQQVLPELLVGEEPHDSLRWRWRTIQEAWRQHKGGVVPERGGVQSAFPQRELYDF